MKAFGKLLGLLILGLLLLVVALGFALTHLFDPNDYKDEIRALARDKANLELTLNGEIGWSLFPWLGLELHDATLASAATPDAPFADLDMLGLSVRVMPLLRREVQMSDIRVEGLNLNLLRDEQGRGNWEDIGRPAETSAGTEAPTEPTAEQPQQTTQAERAPIRLDIDSLSVNNARVDYRDARSGKQFNVEGIELKTGAIREGSEIPVKLSAFFGTNQPVMRARTELEGLLRFDRALKRYQLTDMRLSGEASGEPLQGKTLNYALQGQLLLDQAAQVAELSGLKLSANQLRALGELKIRDLESKPQLSGSLSIAAFDLREFLTGIGQQLPPTADAKTLTHFEFASRLSGTQNSFGFDELTLKLDDSTFTGNLGVSDLATQALRLQLKGDKLDLDRYLPPKAADSAETIRKAEVRETVAAAGQSGSTNLPSSPSRQAWSNEPVLPLRTLRNLDLQAGLTLGSLRIAEHQLENVELKARGKSAVLTLERLRADAYQGSIDASAKIDLRPDVPELNLEKKISRLQVEPFLASDGQPAPMKGRLNLDARLTTSGNSQQAWVENLNGNASFLVSDGVLVDANLEQQLCTAIATLNRKSLSGEGRGRDTPFKDLGGSLQIRNGVATNPDLKARIPGLTVNGNGDLDLRVLGMDYRVGIIIEGDQREMPDEACQVNERYVGLEWPLRCRGPLELGAKACRIDQDGIGKVAARLAGDKLSEKIEEKLGEKVSPELKDALKGLFNR